MRSICDSITLHVGDKHVKCGTITDSRYYSRPSNPVPVLFRIEYFGEIERETRFSFDRVGDELVIPKEIVLEYDVDKITKAAKLNAYESLKRCLGEVLPSTWNDYMFGNINIWTPKGLKSLNQYIIELNDQTDKSREEIAQHIEDLTGGAIPKIPVNPLSWILEDRPMNIDYC